jgi:uncharacterized protein YgbK (DUF1537 family)
MSRTGKIGLIADDFTGAMDTGAQFAKYGFDISFALGSIPDSQAVVLNTASRGIDPQEARPVQASCTPVARTQPFQKDRFDSTSAISAPNWMDW